MTRRACPLHALPRPMPFEVHATEVILLAAGSLLALSVVVGRLARGAGIPVVLLFLALGMLAGSEGIGRIPLEDYGLTYRFGTLALVLILFDGGLRTPLDVLRRALAPAAVLATAGVLLTTAIVGAGAHALGFSWTQGLLLGAIVSSTDAATVFSVLRGGGVHLAGRVAAVVEVESALNDPLAVILTMTLTTVAATGGHPALALVAAGAALQLAIGAAVGLGVGFGGRFLAKHVRLRAGGLYPVLTLSLALVAYGAAALARGSGFLAVYLAAVLLGSGVLPNRLTLHRAHDFMAWASQIGMFVLLGLLVVPSHLGRVAAPGLALALLLALVARPAATAACLLPFGFGVRQIVLVGWGGLRGAVPIVLATIPVLAGVPGAETLFDVVFFVVLLSGVLQGGTVRRVARRLGLGVAEPAVPEAVLEIESTQPLDVDLLTFYVAPASAVCGAKIADIPFPERSSVMLVVRGSTLLAAKGDTELGPGDHVFVFCPRDEAPVVRLLFGREAD